LQQKIQIETEIKIKVQGVLKETVLRAANGTFKDYTECAENVENFRALWRFLPNDLKESIITEVSRQIWSQFPGIQFPIVERLVRNFGNNQVKPEEACKYAYEILSNEVRRREACVQKCVEDADLTQERLVRTIMKCRINLDCYLEEIRGIMDNLGPCIANCMSGKGEEKKT